MPRQSKVTPPSYWTFINQKPVLIFFYFFAVAALGGAGFVLFTRNVMRAAFALMTTLIAIAAIYVLASADFVAVTQLMVYVGGVLVLIIFGVMFTTELSGKAVQTGHHYVTAGVLAGGSVLVALLLIVGQTDFDRLPWVLEATANQQVVAGGTVLAIGRELFTHYVLTLETVGLLLLLALIGAVFIAGRKVQS